MLDSDWSTSTVIPADCVFYNFRSKLMLDIKGNLKPLLESVVTCLLYFRTSSNTNVFNLILKNQIWEVHVSLRNNLLLLEIIDGEPEMLSNKEVSVVFDALSEY